MSQKILVLSGRKQAGKNTTANFVSGMVMQMVGTTRSFNINEKGELEVFSVNEETREEGMAVLDITRTDRDFENYARYKIWPYVKCYSYADALKRFCHTVFNVKKEHLWGTDDQKNEETHINWSDITFVLPPRTVGELKKSGKYDKKMTGRELMSVFGTDVCRRIYHDCWAHACINQIKEEKVPLAIITDCRFPNEVKVAKAAGEEDGIESKIVRLTRTVGDSEHASETALNDYDESEYDFYLDNTDMTIAEQNEEVLNKLVEWDWFTVSEEE